MGVAYDVVNGVLKRLLLKEPEEAKVADAVCCVLPAVGVRNVLIIGFGCPVRFFGKKDQELDVFILDVVVVVAIGSDMLIGEELIVIFLISQFLDHSINVNCSSLLKNPLNLWKDSI